MDQEVVETLMVLKRRRSDLEGPPLAHRQRTRDHPKNPLLRTHDPASPGALEACRGRARSPFEVKQLGPNPPALRSGVVRALFPGAKPGMEDIVVDVDIELDGAMWMTVTKCLVYWHPGCSAVISGLPMSKHNRPSLHGLWFQGWRSSATLVRVTLVLTSHGRDISAKPLTPPYADASQQNSAAAPAQQQASRASRASRKMLEDAHEVASKLILSLDPLAQCERSVIVRPLEHLFGHLGQLALLLQRQLVRSSEEVHREVVCAAQLILNMCNSHCARTLASLAQAADRGEPVDRERCGSLIAAVSGTSGSLLSVLRKVALQ